MSDGYGNALPALPPEPVDEGIISQPGTEGGWDVYRVTFGIPVDVFAPDAETAVDEALALVDRVYDHESDAAQIFYQASKSNRYDTDLIASVTLENVNDE